MLTSNLLKYNLEKESVELYESFNVLSKRELESRVDIKFEAYINTKLVEFRVAINMTRRQILPSIIQQMNDLGSAYEFGLNVKLNSIGIQNDIKGLEELYSKIQTKVQYLKQFLGTEQELLLLYLLCLFL